MPAMLKPFISWPGATSISSFDYTCGHGIGPARAILTLNYQKKLPAMAGNLSFGNGQGNVTLRDCYVERVTPSSDSSSRHIVLHILDRRWQWLTGIPQRGSYNQMDTNGKLIPWTIASPTELATILLRAMGETKYQIALPPGLSSRQIPRLERLLVSGEHFPQTVANPATNWDGIPPAQALQQLASRYQCRVVFDPITDSVGIVPLGSGPTFSVRNDQSFSQLSVGVSTPPLPSRCVVYGANINFQARFRLEAVGLEWDGRYVPIDELSYAPKPKDTPAVFYIRGNPETALWVATITVPERLTPLTGRVVPQHNLFAQGIGQAGLLANLLAQTDITRIFTITENDYDEPGILLTAKIAGIPYDVAVDARSGGKAQIYVVTAPKSVAAPWSMCPPPEFPLVESTARLAYSEAQDRARRSVFRCYRIVNVNPQRNPIDTDQLVIPGFTVVGKLPTPQLWWEFDTHIGSKVKQGQIVRRHQIILTPNKVEQVIPEKRRELGKAFGPHNLNLSVLPEYYNGYSRDQQATVEGTFAFLCNGGVTYTKKIKQSPDGDFTVFNRKGDRCYVPFSIDPEEQLVVFSEPVYSMLAGGVAGWFGPADLVLETGAMVRDATTGAIARSSFFRELGGFAPPEYSVHDDIQYHCVGQYTVDHGVIGYRNEGFGDAEKRASYYLDGMVKKYQTPKSANIVYNGIVRTGMSGSVQEITWFISSGPGGRATTSVGYNDEFEPGMPPYPARVMRENLSPYPDALRANMAENPRLISNALPAFIRSLTDA